MAKANTNPEETKVNGEGQAPETTTQETTTQETMFSRQKRVVQNKPKP